MSDILKTPQYAPEEVIFQIGKQGETVDPALLIAIHEDFIEWHTKTYPQCVFLDSAGHMDEATPHFQDRCFWVAHEDKTDPHSMQIINQEQALEEMGVELPDPTKKKSRYNNRKQTYTAQVREKFIEICMQYGLEIEKEPLEASRVGLTLGAYQRRQEEEKTAKAIEEREAIERRAEELSEAAKYLQLGAKELQDEKKALQAEKEALERDRKALQADRAIFEREKVGYREKVQEGLQALTEGLQAISACKDSEAKRVALEKANRAKQINRFASADGMYTGESLESYRARQEGWQKGS